MPGDLNLKGPNPLSEFTRVDELLRKYKIKTRKKENSNISIPVTKIVLGHHGARTNNIHRNKYVFIQQKMMSKMDNIAFRPEGTLLQKTRGIPRLYYLRRSEELG